MNDNGGINGRPIKYIVHVDPINPELVAAFAKKLIEEEKVVALVGNIDVMDCAVNAAYYAQKNLYVIGDGVHDLCYGGTRTTSRSRDRVQHPRRGPVPGPSWCQVDRRGLSDRGRRPGNMEQATVEFAKSKGPKGIDVHDPYPARPRTHEYVQLAGEGGGVILDFTTDQVLTVLKAAEQQGIANKVLWTGSTPAYDSASPRRPASSGTTSSASTRSCCPSLGRGRTPSCTARWAPSTSPRSGDCRPSASSDSRRESRDRGPAHAEAEPFHREGCEHGVHEDQELEERLLCNPFYSGNLPGHVPNDWDITTTGKDGKMVVREQCFPIAAVTPEIKAARAAEKKFK